jgi:rhamnosyltransferase
MIDNRGGAAVQRKIAIGFVVYHPEKTVLPRMQLASESGFALFIFDNSPQNADVRDLCRKLINCKYVTCGKNVGLGYGISSVCAQAYYEAYPALLFFDQDTVFNQDTLNFIEEFYLRNLQLSSSHSSIVFNSKLSGSAIDDNIKDVLLSRSSGSLFYLDNLKKVNWHNESYFVDCVDYEYCFKSHVHALAIGEYSRAPGFDHVSEQPDRRYVFMGREWLFRRYSLNRIYDTISASIRLLISAIMKGKVKFALMLGRSLAIYISGQIAARIFKNN